MSRRPRKSGKRDRIDLSLILISKLKKVFFEFFKGILDFKKINEILKTIGTIKSSSPSVNNKRDRSNTKKKPSALDVTKNVKMAKINSIRSLNYCKRSTRRRTNPCSGLKT